MKQYKVYKISNSVNSMLYIGSTENFLKTRLCSHISKSRAGDNSPLSLAIDEIGEDKFEICVVSYHQTKQEMLLAEYTTVAALNSVHPNGYNKNSGKKYLCVRKEVHLTPRQFKKYSAAAKAEKTNLKSWMEGILTDHVKKYEEHAKN